jgi:HEAT repeat protein
MSEEARLRQALADLESSDKRKQQSALLTLVYYMRHPLIWLKMTPMLKSSDANIRFLAAGALGRSGDTTAVPYLLEILHDDSANVRQAVAAALGKLNAQDSLPELIDLLHDPVPIVRREAILSLSKLGNFLAAQALTETLGDPDPLVRDTAEQALSLIAPLSDLHSSDPQRQKDGLEKLIGQQHPVVLREVQPFLRHENLDLRRLCIEVLASFENPKALPSLLEAANDPDVYIRGVAAEGLGKLGDPVAVPALELMSHDESPVLRGIAVEALGQLGDPACVPALIARLDDRTMYGTPPFLKSISKTAAEALQKIGTHEAVSALTSRKILVHEDDDFDLGSGEIMSQNDSIRQAFSDLDSGDRTRRIEAIRTLGRLKVQDAVSELVNLLPDAALRDAAAVALVEIGSAAVRDDAELLQQPDFNAAKVVAVSEYEIVSVLRFSDAREWVYVRTVTGAEGWLWSALLSTPVPKVGAKPPEPEPETEAETRKEVSRGIPADLLDDLFDESTKEVAAVGEEAEPPTPPPVVLEPKPVPPPPPPTFGAVPPPGAVPSAPAQPIPAEKPQAAEQAVQFSSYSPKEVPPNAWLPLRAYVYRLFAAPQVAEDAKQELGDAISDFRRGTDSGRTNIQEGAMIMATPELPGFQFNPPSQSILFLEAWHRFDFKLRAVSAPLEQAANGRITFTVEGIIAADIPLSIFVSPTATTPDTSSAGSSAAPTKLSSETRKVYQSIFCSYSHKDTQIIERVEKAYKALGLDFLRDVTTLKSGQDWNAELLNMIDRADIFQLFWSTNASQSKYVRQEWEHALKRMSGREAFIRPVYWEEPLPPVPPELGSIHFAFQPELDD